LEGEAFGLNQNLDPTDPKLDAQAPDVSCISCVSWFLSPRDGGVEVALIEWTMLDMGQAQRAMARLGGKVGGFQSGKCNEVKC